MKAKLDNSPTFVFQQSDKNIEFSGLSNNVGV